MERTVASGETLTRNDHGVTAMQTRFGPVFAALSLLTFSAVAPVAAVSQPTHGIAMYGEPALPQDFAHLPHTNPDAPKGGRIVQG